MYDFQIDHHLPEEFLGEALRADVRRGLTDSPKWLPPKWFYDKAGSELFEEITRLPEYYPTRAEAQILQSHVSEIVDCAGADSLVELGSGSSTKTRWLLDALADTGALRQYVALDVSESALQAAGPALAEAYPGLAVRGLVADFDRHLDEIPASRARLIAFLGGTIGNFEPEHRMRFLGALLTVMQPTDTLLLGTDLVKAPEVLVPAYDDSAGVTGAFNRNVLSVVNRELGADFDVEAFEHIAIWDPASEWIEMRLRARRAMTVRVTDIDLTVDFSSGEEIRTEISAKFRRESLNEEMHAIGFSPLGWWTDDMARFAVSMWQPLIR
jgi:L-histidine N-alpha-methyltransferase